MTNIMELGRDLVEEILCRVRVTSVKRVRSTCKRWNRIFNDKTFVRKHCVKAAKQHMCLILTKRHGICPMSVNLDGNPPSVEVKDELSLLDQRSTNSALQFDVGQVFHCDGLLLCVSDDYRMVVWNPFTGQTRWIKSDGFKRGEVSLGYYQDKRSYTRSYKVLSIYYNENMNQDSKIYDFESDSWRTRDVDSVLRRAAKGNEVSFKGNTYWFASYREQPELGESLLRFDFATDKFGRVPLPYQCRHYHNAWFSLVSEEKLFVLLQQNITSKTEIWVTNQIGDDESESESESNKGVSWSKVLALDLSLNLYYPSLLFHEEKKVVMCCERWIDDNDETYTKDMIYIIGEDSKVTPQEIGVDTYDGCWPAILNYYPSLAQIEGDRGKKRKRLDMMSLLESTTIFKDQLKIIIQDIDLENDIPFTMSLLENTISELEWVLDTQLGISNRNNLRTLLEPYI